MSGPAAGVLLPNDLADQEIAAIRVWLSGVADLDGVSDAKNLADGWTFVPHWPADLGEEPSGDPCPAQIQLHKISLSETASGASFLSPSDWKEYAAALGCMPVGELSIAIACNRDRDHRILAWLCVELADRFDGVIDMDGVLPLPHESIWPERGLRGRAMEVTYSVTETKCAMVQVVDAEFLRCWMAQPEFRMIK